MALSAGTRLGAYEIGAQIGVGGMGEVYRAIDTHLGRPVAIKILPDSFATDPERLARFAREAKTLASLNHANIAQIYGFEKAAGFPAALVMELVDGETLADRIARGPLPLDEALAIARQIAEALETAHEQGIVHRDLKPANVKVRPDGAVKVLDFGLAKLAEPASAANVSATLSPTLSLNATMAGVILGTASYMAPEQARGKSVDRRADIWAFGVVLYEMLTASQLFPGEDVSHVLARVIDREPDWSRLPSTVPISLRVCLQRCLVKDPRQRMRDIGDVRLTLDGAFEPPASSIAPDADRRSSSPSRWPRLLAMVGFSLLLAGLTGLATWILMRAGPLPVSRFELTTPADALLSVSSRPNVAIASDGTVAYASARSVHVRRSGDIDPVPIRGTEGRDLSTVFFSPDGASVGYIEGFAQPFTLKRVPTLGGAVTTIGQLRFPNFGAAWANGNTIVVGSDEGLRRISANGGSVEPLTRVSEKTESHRWPSVLADGRNVLFTVWHGSVETSRLAVASLETGNVTPLGLNGVSPRYSPTGHLVYAAGNNLRAVGFDADRAVITDQSHVVTVLENVYGDYRNGVAYFAIAPNGTLIYFTSPPASGLQTLALVDRAGQAQPIGIPGTGYNYPRVARNGRWVAYQAEYTDGTDIAVFEIGGATAPSRLTFGGKSRYPVWTADSRRVIFQSTREGDAGLFWQPSDGTGAAERLTTAGKDESHVPDSATADGAWLTYTVDRGKVSELWRLSLTTKKTESLIAAPNARVTQSVVSPDGRWIAYQSTETGNEELFVQPFPPSGAKYLVPPANDNHHPIWAPDSTALYYVPGPRLFARLPITTAPRFGFGSPEPLDLNRDARTGGPSQLRRLDIMPDGKRFVGLWPEELGNKSATNSERRIIVIENWGDELKRLMQR